jgi:sodium-dependent dicarboxylate transporter 2/3/5
MATVDTSPQGPAPSEYSANPSLILAGQVLCIVVPLVIWFAPLDADPKVQHVLAIVAFMIIAWMTQAVDYTLTGFIGCYLFWALHIVPFSVAFSGFANDTAWFLFGALLIGLIATNSGVALRIAYMILLRVGITYPRVLLGLIVTDFLLTFIVPSGIARVVIMAAIALGLVEAFGAARGSNVAKGMFLVLTYTANIFDKMIIAGAGSITARGLIEKVGGVEVLWSQWFLAFLPCSILTVLAAWRLTLWFYSPERVTLEGGYEFLRQELKRLGPLSSQEWKAALLIAAAIVLWLTDFIHHVPAPVIGIGVGLFALLPRVEIVSIDDMRRLNYMPVFFVAAAVSMGTVMEATKVIEVLTHSVLAWMQPFLGNIVLTTIVMYWTAFIYHFLLASEISMLATSIPLIMELAKSAGFNPLQLGLIWTFAAGGKLFAYQSGVLIVGYSYGYFEARDLLKMGAWLTVVEFVILVLLVPFYWPLIGIQ